MDVEPREVIRTIRGRLGMSRAEFARALGWSPSTISRWEAGSAQPNRLALKIILAFAEERGVLRERRALPGPGAAPRTTEVEVVPQRFGPSAPRDVTHGDRSPWTAELNVRVAVARGSGSGRWISPALVAGAALCTLLAVGIPGGSEAPAPTRSHGVHAAVTDAPRRVRSRRKPHAVRPAAPLAASDAVAVAATVPTPEPAPPRLARLEGVMVLGGDRRATFRVGDERVTVGEGETIGGRRTSHIDAEGVELVDASGTVQALRVGNELPLD